MSRKLLLRDAHGERDVALGESVTIGRDPACTISVDDPRLSRRHVEFIPRGATVLVRDLGSRNGIEVNGIRTPSAVLDSGDVVVVAGLTLTVAPDDSTPTPAVIDDKTVLAMQTGRMAEAAGRSSDLIDDGTRIVAPAMAHAPMNGPSIVPINVGGPVAGRASGRKPDLSLSGFVFASLATLATLLMVVMIGSTWWLEAHLQNASAHARAEALTHWLASEVRGAGNAQATLDRVTDRIGREPGVTSALVLAPDGRVLAPSARLSESVSRVPGLSVAPRDLSRFQQAADEDALQLVEPVAGAGSTIVWLTFNPSASAGGGALAIGLTALTALFGTLVTANVIRQRVAKGLVRFKEDVELALSGQLTSVRDTLGSTALDELSTVLNYLVLRVRSGTASASDTVSDGSPTARDAHTGARGSGAPSRATEAWMIADAALRIIEASPSCTALFGVRADAFLGRHLLEAFPDRQVGDAVLKCLSTVSISGQDQTFVETPGQSEAGNLLVSVSREGRTDPITVRFAVRRKAAV